MRGLAIDDNDPVAQPRLQSRTGVLREQTGERLIQAKACQLTRHDGVHRFFGLPCRARAIIFRFS